MPDLPWFVYAIPFAFVGLIAVAAITKYVQVRAAAQWPQAPGQVISSRSEVRSVPTFDDSRKGGRGSEQRNFAKVIYEYRVAGQTLRGSRVSIGEDLGNFEVAETIARYPAGRSVTVYYNPKKPTEAVLERDAPQGLWGCVSVMILGGIAATLLGFFGFNQITRSISGVLQTPDRAPLVVALVAFGAAAVVFALMLQKQALQMRRWPQVTGRIERSELDTFRGRLDNTTAETTLYRPLISYAYVYDGVSYSGDQTSLGGKLTSRHPRFAQKLLDRYPAGQAVTIHVNPQNPAQSVLKPNVAGGWILGALAIALWALAAYVGWLA